ncbi:hypothetical protein QYF36_017228 [Acer negundo]|nr:hypothetical protein QYF36_017228 [Acer negundo]
MSSLRCTIAKHPIIFLVDTSTTLNQLKQIHNQLLINGIINDPHLFGQFVASIALNNPINLTYSNRLLDHCHNPTLFTFNSMIRAHCKSSTPHRSFEFYKRIITSTHRLSPDNYTFNFLVRTCAQILSLEAGMLVHCSVLKHGFDSDPHVQSGLIFMYAAMGCLDSCHKVFDQIPVPDLVCQTAIVSACAKWGEVVLARKLFDEMPKQSSSSSSNSGSDENSSEKPAIILKVVDPPVPKIVVIMAGDEKPSFLAMPAVSSTICRSDHQV